MLRSGLRFAAVGLVLCFAMAFVAVDAEAQSTGADKEIATKKGVGESLGTKEFDDDKLPGKLEIGIALGSVAALIGVMKYL